MITHKRYVKRPLNEQLAFRRVPADRFILLLDSFGGSQEVAVVTLETPAERWNEQLESDERWRLVQRIIASRGFQRASQLRSMLLYLASAAILHPQQIIREHQIAQEVLGRRGDFDPTMDNIVRSQMSHLRRKLETFYAEEGRLEAIRITLPKGSYVPLFRTHTLEDPHLTNSEGAAVGSPNAAGGVAGGTTRRAIGSGVL